MSRLDVASVLRELRTHGSRRRAVVRWLLATGGVGCILVGIGMTLASGDSTGPARLGAATSPPTTMSYTTVFGNPSTAGHGGSSVTTDTTAAPAPGSGAGSGSGSGNRVGASDGGFVSDGGVFATTVPSFPNAKDGAAGTPVQSVPVTTTATAVVLVIGSCAFGAGWFIGRRRASEQLLATIADLGR